MDSEMDTMRAEYDFSSARRNPYTERAKKQITINIDSSTIDYFKAEATASGIPYQTLINMYLATCAAKKMHLKLLWEE